MDTIVTEFRSSVTCPTWCVTDHRTELASSNPQSVIVHEGRRQTFGACAVAFDEGPAAPATLWQTRSVRLDGTVVREGAMLNDKFLDLAGLEALAGLS